MAGLAYPLLGLPQIASTIREEHDIDYVEEVTVKKTIKKTRPRDYDLICISDVGHKFQANAIELIREFRERHGDIPLIFGGNNATFMYKNLLQNGADFVVRHEGEITFKELINHLNGKSKKPLKKIKGIAFKDKKGKIIRTPDRPFIKNLDDTPIPYFELTSPIYKASASVETSRGCSYNCNFCSDPAMWKNSWRPKSPERVIMEIKKLEELGARNISFCDDGFAGSIKRVERIAELISKNNIDAEFGCSIQSRKLTTNLNLLKKLSNANFKFISTGPATFSKKAQEFINDEDPPG